MPFTVSYRGSTKRHEFDTYIRLLNKRKIEWTEADRVAEPGTENRWVYVWPSQEDAESFCKEIRKETHDKNWQVQEVENGTEISSGPLMPVIVYMTRQSIGCTFTLHPHSRSAILRRFPQSQQVSSVAIEYGTKFDLEQAHGPIWDHVALVLSGLSLEELATLGGYRVLDLTNEKIIYDSTTVLVGKE